MFVSFIYVTFDEWVFSELLLRQQPPSTNLKNQKYWKRRTLKVGSNIIYILTNTAISHSIYFDLFIVFQL